MKKIIILGLVVLAMLTSCERVEHPLTSQVLYTFEGEAYFVEAVGYDCEEYRLFRVEAADLNANWVE